MSRVTSIVLTCSVMEEDGESEVFPAIDRLNEWMLSEHNCSFMRVTQHAGGNKVMQADVFLSAVNHLVLDEFDRAMVAAKFEDPESVCILLNEEEASGFSEFHWGGRPPY